MGFYDKIDKLNTMIADARRIVFFTGAGGNTSPGKEYDMMGSRNHFIEFINSLLEGHIKTPKQLGQLHLHLP